MAQTSIYDCENCGTTNSRHWAGPTLLRCDNCKAEEWVCRGCPTIVSGPTQVFCDDCSVGSAEKKLMPKLMFTQFHIRRHVAGYTLKDQPIYAYNCDYTGPVRNYYIQGESTQICRNTDCRRAVGLEILCESDSCEYHSVTHYSVLITDSSGEVIGDLGTEFGTDHGLASAKAEILNSLSDGEIQYRVGETKGRKPQESAISVEINWSKKSKAFTNVLNASLQEFKEQIDKSLLEGDLTNGTPAGLVTGIKIPDEY